MEPFFTYLLVCCSIPSDKYIIHWKFSTPKGNNKYFFVRNFGARNQPNLLIQGQIIVFSFLVPCCDVRDELRLKTIFGSSLLPFDLCAVHVLFILSVFIYWGKTRLPYRTIFVSFNSKTKEVTSGAPR